MSFKNDIIFNINIDNTLLSQVTYTKFLGINLDTCLNCKCHLAYLKNKLLKILWIIKNVSYFVNTSAMIKLYYALFYPHLIYCIEIWGHGYLSNLNSIYLIQKKILQIICNKPNDFSTVSLFKENKILSLYDICKYKTCIYIYKIFNTFCHPIILNHFTLTSKKRFNTRSNCDFIQPYFKYNYINNTLITF